MSEYEKQLNRSLRWLSGPAQQTVLKIRNELAEEWSEDVANHIVSTILNFNYPGYLDVSPEKEQDFLMASLYHGAHEVFQVLPIEDGPQYSNRFGREDIGGFIVTF
jgi:hypothetical protein